METQESAWPQLAPMATALAVDDIEAASAFYQKLGFEQTMTLPGPDGELAFAMLVCSTSALLLGPSHELHYANEARTALFRKGPRGLGITMVLDVSGVDAIYEVVQEAQLEIILATVEEYYGERVFMFVDANGYEWKICQKTREVTPEEVADAAIPSSAE